MKSIAQIAAELQGYDPQALSADQVSAFLERLALPVTATEELGIFEALGRVLARDVVSPLSVPPKLEGQPKAEAPISPDQALAAAAHILPDGPRFAACEDPPPHPGARRPPCPGETGTWSRPPSVPS